MGVFGPPVPPSGSAHGTYTTISQEIKSNKMMPETLKIEV